MRMKSTLPSVVKWIKESWEKWGYMSNYWSLGEKCKNLVIWTKVLSGVLPWITNMWLCYRRKCPPCFQWWTTQRFWAPSSSGKEAQVYSWRLWQDICVASSLQVPPQNSSVSISETPQSELKSIVASGGTCLPSWQIKGKGGLQRACH